MDNSLSRGTECKRARTRRINGSFYFHVLALDKDNFMDMIRSGGIVSKW